MKTKTVSSKDISPKSLRAKDYIEPSALFKQLFDEVGETPEYYAAGALLEFSELVTKLTKGMGRLSIAKRIGKTKNFVTRLLRSNVNLTIRDAITILFRLGYKADLCFKRSK
jgi:hypothetical protein